MTAVAELDCAITPTTDGEIAIINLESARQRSWAKLFADPTRDGVAETVVEHEQLTLQFVGDVSALDRVETIGRPAQSSRRCVSASGVDPSSSGVDGAPFFRRQALSCASRDWRRADGRCRSPSIEYRSGVRVESRQRARRAAPDCERNRWVRGFRCPWVAVG